MSVQAITCALAIRGITASEKLVLLALANYADENMQCFPSQKRLADDTCLTERTMRTVIASLTERGMLSKVERRRPDGTRASDLFTLHFAGEVTPQAEIISAGQQPENTSAYQPEICAPNNRKSTAHQAEIISGLTTFEPSLNHQLTPNPSSPGARDYPSAFEAAWRAYPHAKGRSSKPATFEQWRKLPSATRELLPGASERYGREGREPRQDCGAPAMERWLEGERFADWLPRPEPPPETVTPEILAKRVRHFTDTGEWKDHWGPRPKEQAA